MIVLVKVREKSLLKRDYVFNSKENFMLDLEDEFFSHIMINKLVTIQIRNTFIYLFMILKNFKIEKMNDYQKHEYFLISSENKHLAIASNKLIISFNKRAINAQKALKSMINVSKSDKNESAKTSLSEISQKNSLETILLNEIIVHDNKEIVFKIVSVIDKYLNV
jgi:ribosomal protein L17